MISQHLFLFTCSLHETCRVLDVAYTPSPTNCQGFEILRCHHRTNTRTPGCPVKVIHDTGVKTASFCRAPAGRDTELGVLMFLMQKLVRFPYRLTPKVIGGQQLRLFILDIKIDRFIRFTLEDNHVPASRFELCAKKSTRIGARNRAG